MDRRKFYGLQDTLLDRGHSLSSMDYERFERLSAQQQEAWLFVGRNNLRPGDEHPTRKGWYLTDKIGSDNVPLWYKPPHPFWRWFRIGLFTLWAGAILFAIVVTILFEAR